jgi:protein-L-isoaspartate(D-aspartate) O-methyltransferase
MRTEVVCWPIILFMAAPAIPAQKPFLAERQAMVRDQLASRDIRDSRVLEAMRAVPRHRFVPESLWKNAYGDHPLPIGRGQTISQPYIVAVMTEMLRPKADLRVLEIGTGSGYQAAVLSKVFAEVYSIERIPELARTAADRLRDLGYRNVYVRTGDGYLGWPEKALFDRILLTAAPPEVPKPLVDQLARGGRLVAPVGDNPNNQYLVIIDKTVDGRIVRSAGEAVRFVPMIPGK